MTNRKIKFYTSKVLTGFDDAVLQAVTRLTIVGRLKFSNCDIQKMLPENTRVEGAEAKSAQLEAIAESMQALSGVTVRIEETNRQFSYETTCALLEIEHFVRVGSILEGELEYKLAAAPTIGTLGLMGTESGVRS